MAANPFIGQIQAFSFSFAPKCWLPCTGQVLSTSQYPELFNLIGYTYGGFGSTFKVPDLRARVPIGVGPSPSGHSIYALGETKGNVNLELGTTHMPTHTHAVNASGPLLSASGYNGSSPTPGSSTGTLAKANDPSLGNTNSVYNSETPDVELNAGNIVQAVVSIEGNGVPFNFMQPYLVINYCIYTGVDLTG